MKLMKAYVFLRTLQHLPLIGLTAPEAQQYQTLGTGLSVFEFNNHSIERYQRQRKEIQ